MERRRGSPTSSPPRPIHHRSDAPDGSTSPHYDYEYVICRIDKLKALHFDYLNFTMPTADDFVYPLFYVINGNALLVYENFIFEVYRDTRRSSLII